MILFADILFEENILQKIIDASGDISIALDKNWAKRYDKQKNKQYPALVEIKKEKIVYITEHYKNTNNETAEFLGIVKLSEKGSKILVDTIQRKKNHIGKFHDSINFKSAKLTDILQEIILAKQEISPIFVNGKWIEVDTEDDLIIAKKMFR